MKKVLMVLSLAMCASVAFAQTNMVGTRTVNQDPIAMRAMLQPRATEKAPVDYKASVFTKDATYDTLHVFRFGADEMSQITTGNIANTDHIWVNGVDSTFGTSANAVNPDIYAWNEWARYDSATFIANFRTDYPGTARSFFGTNGNLANLFRYIGAANASSDTGYVNNGFMVFGFENQNALGNVNTYFQLPAVSRPSNLNNKMVLVGINQFHAKYYERCFIDYKIGNNWHAREINVEGVDAEINYLSSSKIRYVMPANLATATGDIVLRIRINSTHRGSAYGYGWFLDNIAVIVDTRSESWEFNTETTTAGMYGQIPQNFNMPISYGLNVRNTNLGDIANARLSIYSGALGSTFAQSATSTSRTIPSGDVSADYKLYIEERGFVMPEDSMPFGNYNGYHGWLTDYENYGNTGALTGGYQGRGLSSSTLGLNGYYVVAEGGNSLSREFDTVLYNVTDYEEFDQSQNRVDGYRWSRDNGLIPSGSIFAYSITDDGFITNNDMGDDGTANSSKSGYYVYVRYVTGNDIPANTVIRGVEYVPATNLEDASIMATEQGVIVPIVMKEVSAGEGTRSFSMVPCGIDNLAFAVPSTALNNLPSTGFRLPNQEYSALNILFRDQPTLEPNTSYMIGYQLNGATQFHVASQAYNFTTDSGTVSYRADAASAPFINQNMTSTPYDVYVYDPVGQTSNGGHTINGWNIEEFPMIRLIVGEPDPVVRVNYIADCSENSDTAGIGVDYGSLELCGNDEGATPAQGASASFDVYPVGNHSIINAVYLDGVEVPIYDENGDIDDANGPVLYEHDYNVYDTVNGNPRLRLSRSYFTLQISDVQPKADGSSHVITADYTISDWIAVGIDDAAPEFGMSLYPNPATSTVKINMDGITGMVNCNIIDMSGRVIYNANINSEVETTINVSNIPAGAYFVRITNDTFSKIEKLIIK